MRYAGGGKTWKPNPRTVPPLTEVRANPNPQAEVVPEAEDRINRLLEILDLAGEVIEGLEAEVEEASEQIEEAKEEAEEVKEEIEEEAQAEQSPNNPTPVVPVPPAANPLPKTSPPLLKRLLLGG